MIEVRLGAGRVRRAKPVRHEIAGTQVWVDGLRPELEPFAVQPGRRGAPLGKTFWPPDHFSANSAAPSGGERAGAHGRTGEASVYRGPGSVGGAERLVECRLGSQGYWLSVEGVGACWIAVDGSVIEECSASTSAQPHLGAEIALGPALVLALAIHGRFCLHAGAVVQGDGTVAFVGESGAGKSWIARELGAGELDWQRLADDVLPVCTSGYGPMALPRFPQQKLPPDEQPALRHPARLPLAAVYVVDGGIGSKEDRGAGGKECPGTGGKERPGAAGTERPVSRVMAGGAPVGRSCSAHAYGPATMVEHGTRGSHARDEGCHGARSLVTQLDERTAMLELVRHTVAARLFDRPIAKQHLAFCAAVASAIPVRRLAYHRDPSVIPALRQAIAADLAAL